VIPRGSVYRRVGRPFWIAFLLGTFGLLAFSEFVGAEVVKLRQGGGGGVATAVTPGSTTVTGCQNRVIYGDNSEVLNCDADLVFSGGNTFESSAQTNISGPDATTNVEIGSTANNANAGTGGTSIAIGDGATNTANGTGSIAIGSLAALTTGSIDSMAIGRAASVTNHNGMALGAAASSGGNGSYAIGNSASAAANGSIALGSSAVAATGELVAGSTATTINNLYFGKGKTSTTATDYAVNGTGGSGTNNAGAGLLLAAGKGTGTAAGGPIVLRRSPAIASGTTAQTLVDAQRVCSKAVTLTNSTATIVAVISGLGAHQATGGQLFFGVRTSDATNDAQSSGMLSWSFIDTTAGAGGETCAVSVTGVNSSVSSSGTLTVTADTTTGTGICNLRLTSTQSVMTPTTNEAYVTIIQNGALGTLACQ
jgi:hypothetical protein